MSQLEQLIQTLKGIKLQANIACSSMTTGFKLTKEHKEELTKAHSMIIPKMLSHPWLKEYMIEKKIVSFPDIELDDFKVWFENKREEYQRDMESVL